MMQFTENKKFTGWCTVPVLMAGIILVVLSGSFANTQYDVTMSEILGADSVGSKKLNKAVINSGINLHGNYTLAPGLFLLLYDKFDLVRPFNYGRDTLSNRLYPLYERYVLSTNTAELGLRLTRLGNAELSVRHLAYIDTLSLNDALSPRAYDHPRDSLTLDSINSGSIQYNGSQMIRKAKANAELYWDLPLGPVQLKADVNYFFNNYTSVMRYSNWDQNISDSVLSRANVTDVNQLINCAVRYNLPLDFNIEAGAFLNQDLSGHSFTNLYLYDLMAGGEHEFPGTNRFTWKAGTEWLQRSSKSSMPEEYASSLYNIPPHAWFRFYFRDVCTLAWGLFLKATVAADLGKDLYKQRYEIELRKAWENTSSFDIGYYIAINGLFPLSVPYLKFKICPVPVLEFSGSSKFMWEQIGKYNAQYELTGYKYEYMKNLSSAEIAWKPLKFGSIFGGIDYTYFSRINYLNDNYPDRFAMFAGIRGMF